MNILLVLTILAILLFVLSFLTRRRFGILGLALFAGSYLAHTWTGAATPFIEKVGLDLTRLGVPTSIFVGALLTLLPAIILLANSPKYKGKEAKFFGSLGFTALAIILLVPMLKPAFIGDSTSDNLDTFIVANYSILITIGLIASIVDLFLSHNARRLSRKHTAEH